MNETNRLYSVSICLPTKYQTDKKLLDLIEKASTTFHSTGSIIWFKGDAPHLHCIVKEHETYLLCGPSILFKEYDVKVSITSYIPNDQNMRLNRKQKIEQNCDSEC